MLNRDTSLSRTLDCLRYPLVALIVLHHSYLNQLFRKQIDPDSIIDLIGSVVLNASPHLSISTLFFISGYIFFFGRKHFNTADYKKSVGRKTKTILLPYLIWGTIAYLSTILIYPEARPDTLSLKLLYQLYIFGDSYNSVSNIFDYTWSLKCFPGCHPAFWFLRDLYAMFLLTPIIWHIAKRLRLWLLPILGAAFLLGTGLPGGLLGLEPICFFTAGATLAICDIDIEQTARRSCKWLIVPFVALLLLVSWACNNFDINHFVNGTRTQTIIRCMQLTALMPLIAMASWTQSRQRLGKAMLWLAPSAFHLYIIHDVTLLTAPNIWLTTHAATPWLVTLAYTLLILTLTPLLTRAKLKRQR